VPIVNAYLNGDHRGVLNRVSNVDSPSDPLAFQLSLFAAASSYALFERGQPRDAAHRDAAIRYVRDCRRLQPGVQLDPLVFSPRFRAFYDGIR
jgi:hypothetical protein